MTIAITMLGASIGLSQAKQAEPLGILKES